MYVGHFLLCLIRVVIDVYLFARLLLLVGILDIASPIAFTHVHRLFHTGLVRLMLRFSGWIVTGRMLSLFTGRVLVGGLLSLHWLIGAFLLPLLLSLLLVLVFFHTPAFNR